MSTPRTARSRLVGALIAVVSVTAAMLIAPAASAAPQAAVIAESAVQSPVPSTVRPAANLALFNPGYIISDGVFFNSGTMTEAQIQAFITSKSPNCRSGYVCLKDWRDTSRTTVGDAMCGPYQGAANERASTIIYKVARACGINPQVILATLEKEQSLVSHTWPSTSRFTIAMGQGCPDTAACDTRYYGFFNQVYGAAWQLKRYGNPPGTSQYFTWYAPGRVWNVRYNPNAACGSAPVFIQNQATANLYYYTPYQPNRAALAAGYGLGDGCSSYGNRNFYQFFTDWFGSTSYAVTGGLLDYWSARGGAGGYLGEPTSSMTVWTGAGWSQPFVNADLLQKAGRGVVAVGGAFRAEYRVVGHFWSGLGWPSGEQAGVLGGWYQNFDGGRIYVRPDGGGFAIAAPFHQAYESLANITGWLGWPAGRAYRAGAGARQDFDGGSMFSGPQGVFALPKDVIAAYTAAGGPAGGLGLPTSGVQTVGGSTFVTFQSGLLQKTGSGFVAVSGPIGAAYMASGGMSGPFGLPTGAQTADARGTSQTFQNATIYSSAAGAFAVRALRADVAAHGGVAALGYPTGPEFSGTSGVSQAFGAISLTRTPQGPGPIVRGSTNVLYAASGGASSVLGTPTAGERSVAGGWTQDFTGGRILVGPRGTFLVPSAVAAVHDTNGATAGRLGWPTAPAVSEAGGGWRQAFAGGTIYAGPSAGGAVFGAVLGVYASAGGPAALGYPASREAIVPQGAWRQTFERGAVYIPSAYPATAVSGDIYTLFSALGSESGAGLPTAARATAPGGSFQNFQALSIYATGTGPWYTRGLIRDLYQAWGGPSGTFGWPTQSQQTVPGGWRQAFTGGGIFVGPTGTFLAKGSLGREYVRRGGEASPLGWPISGESLSGGLWTQRFQNGTLVLLADGTFQVR